MPQEMMEKLKGVETTMEFEQNGDVIKETFTAGPKVTRENYTIGKESEFNTWDDKTVKVLHRHINSCYLLK